MSVDLPAPLAPTSPTTPGSTSTVSSSRASTPGNRMPSPRVAMMDMRRT